MECQPQIQSLGLNAWASKFVQDAVTKEKHRVYARDGKKTILHRYILSDGNIVFEGVQSVEWNHCAVVVLCLYDEEGATLGESIWSGAEMNQYL